MEENELLKDMLFELSGVLRWLEEHGYRVEDSGGSNSMHVYTDASHVETKHYYVKPHMVLKEMKR